MNNQNKKPYLMYMHAGSGNHGCEAIVRSLCGLSENNLTVLSHKAYEDEKYGLNELCDIFATKHVEENFLPHVYFYALKKLFHNGEAKMKYAYKNAGDFKKFEYAISIGGDNYCYDDTIYDLRMANSMFVKEGVKTALIGCSVEPDLMNRSEIIEDLKKYSVIIARESITYKAISEAVGNDTDVHMVPDPAFTLKPVNTKLPDGFEEGETVGINVSPLILGYESAEEKGITLKNYEGLIEYILENSEDKIALIPHVVWPGNDDREPINILFEKYKDTGRIVVIEDMSASELKYVISKCRLFIGARTHATIAAYSTCVPTLVAGYSVKSKGIATDLFGTDENYVIPVQSLNAYDDLKKAYIWLEENAENQKTKLNAIMPEYIEKARHIWDYLK